MGLSPEDKIVLAEACKLHESAPNQVSAAQLAEVVRIVGANPSDEELEAFAGNKATFSVNDIANFLERQLLHQDPTKLLKDSFAIFDAEGTGMIDASEFRQVLGGLGERFHSHEIEEIMRRTEVDNDGKITYDDFIQFAVENK
eukprot:m.23928 g.23928  ORF g.23928 m.23928 type:complete len:143 (+) comp5597_c0_seq1:163-591(+)